MPELRSLREILGDAVDDPEVQKILAMDRFQFYDYCMRLYEDRRRQEQAEFLSDSPQGGWRQ